MAYVVLIRFAESNGIKPFDTLPLFQQKKEIERMRKRKDKKKETNREKYCLFCFFFVSNFD